MWSTISRFVHTHILGTAQTVDPRLPAELWFIIFDLVDNHTDRSNATDLLPLTRVCRAFQPIAEAALYRQINLLRNPDRQLERFKAAVKKCPRRAIAVKYLRFRFWSSSPIYLAVNETMRLLVNLRHLDTGSVGNAFPLLFGVPFKLHTLSLKCSAFRDAHESMRGIHGATIEDDTQFPLDALANLHTLTLEYHKSASRLNFLRPCQLYNITHFCLSLVPSWTPVFEVFRMLGPQLMSLKIALDGTKYDDDQDAEPRMILNQHLWPTGNLHDYSFSQLKYLEIDDNTFDYIWPEAEWGCGQGFHPDIWQSACPGIKTFVWHPPRAHKELARDIPEYRDSFPGFNVMLFDTWKTLERFERPDLESGMMKLKWSAFTRGETGGICGCVCEYDEDAWSKT